MPCLKFILFIQKTYLKFFYGIFQVILPGNVQEQPRNLLRKDNPIEDLISEIGCDMIAVPVFVAIPLTLTE